MPENSHVVLLPGADISGSFLSRLKWSISQRILTNISSYPAYSLSRYQAVGNATKCSFPSLMPGPAVPFHAEGMPAYSQFWRIFEYDAPPTFVK